MDCQKSNNDFILFLVGLLVFFMKAEPLHFKCFMLQYLTWFFSWSKNSYTRRYFGNILYLQLEDIWTYICFLYLIAPFFLVLILWNVFCHSFFIFSFTLPFRKSSVNSELPSLAAFSQLSYYFLQSLPLLTIL